MRSGGDKVLVAGQVLSGPDGVPHVTVSDGVSVARTDPSGHYSLYVDPHRRHTSLVFITQPAGWRVPVDESCTPMFFRRVDASDRAVDNIDFSLLPDPAAPAEDYRFVALADVHVQAGAVNTRETYSGQLAHINQLARELTDPSGPPRFVTVAGDLTNDATDAEFRDYLAASSASSIPVWSAPGNHDLVGRESGGPHPKPRPQVTYRDAVENYRQYVGPEWYSFQYGSCHFVVLENYWGLDEPDQLTWLERDLASSAGNRVVVISHVPWNVPQTPERARTAPYLELFQRYGVCLLLAGHTHSNDVSPGIVGDAVQAVTTSAAQTLDQTPRGFRMVELRNGGVRFPFWELDAHRTTTVVYPVGTVPKGVSTVRVNRYSPPDVVTEVEFRLPSHPWRPLRPMGRRTWTAELDPVAAAVGQPQRLDVRARDGGDGGWTEASTTFEARGDEPPVPRQGTAWPMFHADAGRSGVSVDAVVPPCHLAWVRHAHGTILTSSPVVDHSTVYIGVRDEDGWDGNGVLAVDLPTGALRWRVTTRGPVDASVAVTGEMVVVPSVRGPLAAFDSATGQPRWQWAPDQPSWMYFAPAVVDDIVYQAYSVPSGTWVAALRARTGRPIWQLSEPIGRNWISYGSPAVAGGKLYFATAYANLVAVDTATGEVRWQHALGAGLGVRAAPVVAGGLVLLACQGDLVVGVDAATGARRWSYTSGGESLLAGRGTGATPAVAGGLVYAGFANGRVAALRLDTGEPVWQHQTEGAVISSPAISGDVLYVGSHDGRLRALDRHTGQCRWSYDVGAWVATSPAVTGNVVVAGAWDGNVYAFTSGEGERSCG